MDPKIREALYDRYIIPTEEKRADYVGIEISFIRIRGFRSHYHAAHRR